MKRYRVAFDGEFREFRELARCILDRDRPPNSLVWEPSEKLQETLFDDVEPLVLDKPVQSHSRSVPRLFLQLAEQVSAFRAEDRWDLLYRILWRLVFENPLLLELKVDPDVHAFFSRETAVRRDLHKMKAFVRFRECNGRFIAWYEPDHEIVALVAPWFAQRFSDQEWSILTPDLCAHWDREQLTLGPGVSPAEAPEEDNLEDLWRSYYGAIFNPSRIHWKAMTKEFPVRRWKNLPEAQLIAKLVRESPERTQKMLEQTMSSAESFVPKSAKTIEQLRTAANHCEGCELYREATQTVFGEGPQDAEVVLVGEAPGDEEDRKGHPFVGPAGKVLDRALREAGVERDKVYLTNAVKHFKYEQTEKRRLHKKPSSREIAACRPWLYHELKITKPKVLILLGATAAQSVLGKAVKLGDLRGKTFKTPLCEDTIATYHPSAILRMPDEASRAQSFAELVSALSRIPEILSR